MSTNTDRDTPIPKQQDHKPEAEPTETPAPPKGLLSLPPELRNQIYEQALISPSPIPVASLHDTRQPPLLRVNRQIRNEASAMYYHFNKFQIMNDDFDSKPLQLWRRHSRRHLRLEGERISNTEVVTVGRPRSWRKLVKWVRAVYEDEEIPGLVSNGDPAMDVAQRLFRIATNREGLSFGEFARKVDAVMAEERPIRAGGVAWT